MDIEKLRGYCLSKTGATEDFPFDESTLAFRIKGKIFCIIDLDKPDTINLKCDPERALELREEHEDIIPGFHMNKRHWNTVNINGTLKDRFIFELIDHSYDMVVKTLPKKLRSDISGE